MLVELALIAMLISMVMVLKMAWKWFGSLRTAFIIMLIVGKVWAGMLWAFGIDRPLFTLVVYNKLKGVTSYVTIYATQMVFISFLVTLLATLAWPYIESYLPEPIRRLEVIRR
ncbi:hypothetical protein JdFRA1000001_18c [uncultured archaeal virus]|uniref:Uncharacterized protein n=1 Tax=uncultured archaeal virus TaxID=1960247 RepID=A0A1S5Y2W6_9VIRU|nr:hypothetical protein JdFRA1000001_18c [uncultured archaeal virus]